MFEKVNPMHPDKIADRIAGAIVDMAYEQTVDPRIAVEVLIGHKSAKIIAETSVSLDVQQVTRLVKRLANQSFLRVSYREYKQDEILAGNQASGIRCGDNGIFRGMPVTAEQKQLTQIAREIYGKYRTDGKYILDGDRLIICQSYALKEELAQEYPTATINPLGFWTGGTDVDTGATNRKLGSDMGDAVTGGGLHGKDLSKADVSVNIYAHIKAQVTRKPVELCCAIGDDIVDGRPYAEIVEIARTFIKERGGFEKLAEWGLIV